MHLICERTGGYSVKLACVDFGFIGAVSRPEFDRLGACIHEATA